MNNNTNKVGVILARFQPIHNGHLALIEKALKENDKVLILVGSANKLNARNPIPWNIRLELVQTSLSEVFPQEQINKITLQPLDDLTNECDNTHDWGFYLYTWIVCLMNTAYFTIYYSDGYEIITKWFPGFLLRDCISLALLARNAVETGISATKVREYIQNNNEVKLVNCVPKCVFHNREQLKTFISMY